MSSLLTKIGTSLPQRLSSVSKRLSDAELLVAILHTNDPLNLSMMSTEPPAPDMQLTFEMVYDADASVQCVFGHWHKKGIILRDGEGLRYPLGHTCGKEKYGVDWNLMQNASKALSDRQYYLLRLTAIRGAVQSERDWLKSLPQHPAVLAFDELRQAFVQSARPLYESCCRAANHDGVLRADVPVRDYAAEERRREQDEEEKREFAAMSAKDRADYLKRYGVPGSAKNGGQLFKKQPRTLACCVERLCSRDSRH